MGEIGQKRGSAWGGWNGWGRVGASVHVLWRVGVFDSESRVVKTGSRWFGFVSGEASDFSGQWSAVGGPDCWEVVGRSLGAQSKIGDGAGFAGAGWKGPSFGGDGTADGSKSEKARPGKKRTNDTTLAPKVDEIQSIKRENRLAGRLCNQVFARLAGDDGLSGDDGFRLRPVWGILQLKWPSPGPHRRSRRRKGHDGSREGARRWQAGVYAESSHQSRALGRALETAQPLSMSYACI